MWPTNRFIELTGTKLPIIQAPMAGAALSDMVVAVSEGKVSVRLPVRY